MIRNKAQRRLGFKLKNKNLESSYLSDLADDVSLPCLILGFHNVSGNPSPPVSLAYRRDLGSALRCDPL